jgi:outer membrane protein assembly factor BamB
MRIIFNRKVNKTGYLLILSMLINHLLSGQETAQWRGPERNGIYPDKELLDEWPDEGPELLWSMEGIGKGFSSVSVINGVIYATGSFKDTRCTPTVEGDKAFLISGRGEIVCVDVSRRQIKWHVEANKNFKGLYGIWEISESPLLVDNKVIFTPGGHTTTMIALDKQTGATIWTSETIHDTTSYASPVLIERGDKRIIVNILSNYLIGVDAENGEILWTYKYSELDKPLWNPDAPYINTISPLYKDGRLFITSGYNHTSAMFELSPDGSEISLIWKQPVLDTQHGGVLLLEGYIYGSTWISNGQGNWACIDWETGEIMYDKEWYNKGSIISADGKLIVYEEKQGYVGLVNPNPEDFQVISSFRHKQGSGPHWAHPSIKDGVLYIRHGETLTAYRIGRHTYND